MNVIETSDKARKTCDKAIETSDRAQPSSILAQRSRLISKPSTIPTPITLSVKEYLYTEQPYSAAILYWTCAKES